MEFELESVMRFRFVGMKRGKTLVSGRKAIGGEEEHLMDGERFALVSR